MPPPAALYCDLAMARELELAEAAWCAKFAQTAARIHPDLPVRVVPAAGGIAKFYGPNAILNAVKGAGLSGPVQPDEWSKVESIFLDAASPVTIDLCPHADPTLIAILGDRGYRITAFESVTARTITAGESYAPASPPRAGVTVEQSSDPAEWGRIIDVGFANGGEPANYGIDLGRVRAASPDSIMLLARVDGQPAGGAGLSVAGRVALFSGAAVLPQFRAMGVQSLLTAARLEIARDRGCALAKCDVLAGSVSHRNATRAGFALAYTRPQMVRTP